MERIDILGHRFGRWTVTRRADNTIQGQSQWLCRCDCGTQKVLKSIVIRRGISQSCGCLKSELTSERSYKHGHSTSTKTTPTYYSWAGMIARCTNQNHKAFHLYGGRGITVCARWLNSFADFLADMGEKPHRASIDRKNNEDGYHPKNCQWSTPIEQARNRRDNRLLTIGSDTRTLAEWSGKYGVNYSTIQHRLKNGWTAEDAIKPGRGGRRKLKY